MAHNVGVPDPTVDRIFALGSEIYRATAAAVESLWPDRAPAHAPIGTGSAVFCGDGSPLTQVARLAVGSRAHEKELDAVEEFFAGRAKDWEYVVTPYSDPDLLAMVVRRGWTNVQYENVLTLDLDAWERPAPVGEATVSVVGDSDCDVWKDVALRGFFGDDVPPEMAELGDVIAASVGTVAFLARFDGVPAAAATLFLADGSVYLGGAATLAPFRNRGAQSSLLAARMAYAKEHFCSLAVCECLPGSQSQRNQARAGFTVAYTKIVLTRPPARVD